MASQNSGLAKHELQRAGKGLRHAASAFFVEASGCEDLGLGGLRSVEMLNLTLKYVRLVFQKGLSRLQP